MVKSQSGEARQFGPRWVSATCLAGENVESDGRFKAPSIRCTLVRVVCIEERQSQRKFEELNLRGSDSPGAGSPGDAHWLRRRVSLRCYLRKNHPTLSGTDTPGADGRGFTPVLWGEVILEG